MHLLRLFSIAALSLGLLRAADAPTPRVEANDEAAPKTFAEAMQRAGVNVQSGPATVALGKVAELKLPEGYDFIGPESLDRFYQLTQNVRSGNELGVVRGPGYTLFFDFDDIGYVKDEDKDELNASKLMSAMTENQEAGNAARKQRGWDELKLQGWATEPHYDAKTNNLKWAIKLSSSQDGFKGLWINESIRLLGRGGVMNVTLASDTEVFQMAEADADALLATNFSYVAGQKYSEFKSGDKVAAYGLSALVLGGAGVMAAKAGLFAKLGVFLGKAWKAIVFGLIALVAVLKKIFNRITGAQPKEPNV